MCDNIGATVDPLRYGQDEHEGAGREPLKRHDVLVFLDQDRYTGVRALSKSFARIADCPVWLPNTVLSH
jgi:hypothetical protein